MHEVLFTIGHSNHSGDWFSELLTKHHISAVADVRSRPFSRRFPQFNRENLYVELKRIGVCYAFLGQELGARTDDLTCYVDGKVQYDLLAKTALFQSGVKRLLNGVRSHRIALMCAERDPITCHRMILVCHALRKEPLEIAHISADGSLESNTDAEKRLVRTTRLPESDLFTSPDEAVEDAYCRQAQRIAWVQSSTESLGEFSAVADAESCL
jgi:uncharacterized protein (DUF488 family)